MNFRRLMSYSSSWTWNSKGTEFQKDKSVYYNSQSFYLCSFKILEKVCDKLARGPTIAALHKWNMHLSRKFTWHNCCFSIAELKSYHPSLSQGKKTTSMKLMLPSPTCFCFYCTCFESPSNGAILIWVQNIISSGWPSPDFVTLLLHIITNRKRIYHAQHLEISFSSLLQPFLV